MNSWQGEKAAVTRDIEAVALDRYTLETPDPKGVVLGFAAFDEATIRTGLIRLAAALGRRQQGRMAQSRIS
jgi:GntR family transcriptional regulator / MocR family aminotransferase